MTSLYNCRHSGDQYRISKFDSHFDLEASYLVDATACECPAGHRTTCRHREMLPKFINRGHVGDEWFFDHDRGGWVQGEALLGQMAEIGPLASAASAPPGTATAEQKANVDLMKAGGTITTIYMQDGSIETFKTIDHEPHSPTGTTTGFDPVDDGSIPSVVAKIPTIRRRV